MKKMRGFIDSIQDDSFVEPPCDQNNFALFRIKKDMRIAPISRSFLLLYRMLINFYPFLKLNAFEPLLIRISF